MRLFTAHQAGAQRTPTTHAMEKTELARVGFLQATRFRDMLPERNTSKSRKDLPAEWKRKDIADVLPTREEHDEAIHA